MSSKVRYVLNVGGGFYKGSEVFRLLKRSYPGGIRCPADVITAARALNLKLWMFREPRSVSTARSRYKKYCRYLGLPMPAKQKSARPAAQAVANVQYQYINLAQMPPWGMVGGNNAANQERPAPPGAADPRDF